MPSSYSAASTQHAALISEQTWEVWVRRCITIPAYLSLASLAACALPVLGTAAAAADLARRKQWATLRCLAFVTFYLLCEAAGIVASFALWLARLVGGNSEEATYLRRNFMVQCVWARTLLRGAQRIFGMEVEVTADGDLSRGPLLVFSRHASIGDTLLPSVYLSNQYGHVLRYVLKRELLWDPCLDIVGNRLPNYFVRRGSSDSDREIAAVEQLAENLGPHDGVLIYPEGTRFTPAKRDRAVERVATKMPPLAERARQLRSVLPPRLGGTIGLLQRNRNADVVFCAHTGFEETGTLGDLLNGALVHRRIRVHFWRVPFAEIPRDREAQIAWFYDQWARVDDWVCAQQASVVK